MSSQDRLGDEEAVRRLIELRREKRRVEARHLSRADVAAEELKRAETFADAQRIKFAMLRETCRALAACRRIADEAKAIG